MSELERPGRRVTVTQPMLYGAGSLGLLVVSAGCWIAFLTDGSWADAAGWVEALATVAAFGAAIVAALLVRKTLELELDREDRRREDDASSQAALVAAWPDAADVEVEYNVLSELEEPKLVVGVFVFVRNASQVPVTEVEVTVAVRGRPWSPAQEDDPTAWPLVTGTMTRAYLAPKEQAERWQVWCPEPLPLPNGTENVDDEVAIDIEFGFTDAAGRRWLRTSTGLTQLD